MLDLFLSKTAGKEYLDLESYKAVMKEIQKETGTKGRPLYMAVRSIISYGNPSACNSIKQGGFSYIWSAYNT